MSSPNHSSCLIDLSVEDSPTSNMTPMISFPPISANELIVQPLERLSLSNNPFDMIEKQAKLFGDPFEITQFSPLPQYNMNNIVVPTGALIDVEGDKGAMSRAKLTSMSALSSVIGNSLQLSFDKECNNSQDLLNPAMYTVTSITPNSSIEDKSSDTLNKAFLQSDLSIKESNSTNRNRIHSDPVTTKLSKTMRKIGSGKTRSASLEQLCLKKQLRKSLSNSPGSPNWLKSNGVVSAENSLYQRHINSPDFNRTSDSIFDDLSSTKPEWIDSDNDDSDLERMTIPFLKNHRDSESTVETSADGSSDRSKVIEKLSKYRQATKTVADVTTVIDIANNSEDKPNTPMDMSPQVNNITSIIETLRNAVKNCGDEKKKDEASALLDNLNQYFSSDELNNSKVTINTFPQPIVRQRTFSVEDHLSSDAEKSTPEQISRELSNSMPVISAPTRKSINVTTPITSRRISRSASYGEKPVSVVSAIQTASNSHERRSSVCTTPTRLVRPLSSSNLTSTRTSLSRQSLPSPTSKPVVKPVQRKTIMKASNPLSSNTVSRALKLRVVEQTKPSGPLKAVIPYQRASIVPNNIDLSTKVKKYVQTSTPLAPNNLPKSSIPAASSTPVVNTDKPSLLSVHRPSQNRLSYTPSTPVGNPFLRQPSSERKKRSVTFSDDADKMSRSMIVGSSNLKDTTLPPVSCCTYFQRYIFFNYWLVGFGLVFRFRHYRGDDCQKVMVPIKKTQFFKRNRIATEKALAKLRISRPLLVIYFLYLLEHNFVCVLTVFLIRDSKIFFFNQIKFHSLEKGGNFIFLT